ncbi:MAG: PaaI family thioesterase [Pseudomonadota bacterium]
MAETYPADHLPAYARSLGITIDRMENNLPVLTVDFGPNVEGRPGAFHGGATAGLLENAGYAALRTVLLRDGRDPVLKPINITVQYLSAGKQKQTYALGRITRLGRRNANLTVEAWQDDRERLIASAVMNILMA